MESINCHSNKNQDIQGKQSIKLPEMLMWHYQGDLKNPGYQLKVKILSCSLHCNFFLLFLC